MAIERRDKAIVYAANAIAVREVYHALVTRRGNRKRLYALARARADATGKPLIVVGAPGGGIINRFVGQDYGCGDVCIDLVGCKGCDGSVSAPIERYLPTLKDGSAVIYVSAVLEYVRPIKKVISELRRVSGGDLYVVTVEPWTLTSFFYTGARRQFFSAPPLSATFKWQEFR